MRSNHVRLTAADCVVGVVFRIAAKPAGSVVLAEGDDDVSPIFAVARADRQVEGDYSFLHDCGSEVAGSPRRKARTFRRCNRRGEENEE